MGNGSCFTFTIGCARLFLSKYKAKLSENNETTSSQFAFVLPDKGLNSFTLTYGAHLADT